MERVTFRYLHWYVESFGTMCMRDALSLTYNEAILSTGAYLYARR